MNLLENEYKFNSSFRKLVDEYCEKNGSTLEEAFRDEKIKRKFWMYTEV